MGNVKKNYIGGEWLASDDVSENRNPARPDEIIGHYARATNEQLNQAVAAAKAAQPAWAAATPQLRSDVLGKAAAIMMERSQELGRLLSREEGKTLAEGVGEIVRSAQIFQFYCGEALRIAGQKFDSVRPGVEAEITREPIGVVGLVTPWNFPTAIPAWKSAPALAAGNAVVLKPAELTPASAHVMTEILIEAGVPAGVFNLVMGSGSRIGQALVEHPDVAGISFTGSVPVGRGIARTCAERMKKVQLEMGGKNPLVVLDDADLDIAVNCALNGAFFSTGQKCTASSRLIVQAGIHDAFVEKLNAARAALRLGDPLDANTQIGPVVSESQLNGNLEYVALAAEEGCEVVGGERLNRDGYFQTPALFLGANNAMRSAREEIFGPCASVIKVGDFDEALAVANDTEFGLSSAICTSSLKSATTFRRQSQAGMAMVNLPTAGVDYHVPFGGRKASSLGSREQGALAMEFYTAVKTSYVFAG